MRTIPIRDIAIVAPSGQRFPEERTVDLMIGAARFAPNGITVGQMERALSLLSALTAARDAHAPSVILEEPDWEYLAARIAEFPWPVPDAAIAQMARDIREAPRTDPNKAAPKPAPRRR